MQRQSASLTLTVAALLPSSPITGALCPAAHTAALHRALGANLGEAAQRRVVVSVVVHGRAGYGGAEAAHGGVPRQQCGGASGAHSHHGAAEDVVDAVWRPWLQLAVEAWVELVERVGHGVLAHRSFKV